MSNYSQVETFLESQDEGGSDRIIVYGLETLGFFAEINLLSATLTYCLANNIRFYLDDSHWNHRISLGWHDYFRSLTRGDLFIVNAPAGVRARWVAAKLLYKLSRILPGKRRGDFLGLSVKSPGLTDEILQYRFNRIRNGTKSANFVDLQRQFARLIFQFSPDVLAEIQRRAGDLGLLTESYASIHIRRGDKILEASRIATERYLDCVDKCTSGMKRVFVGSDDYAVVEEIRMARPQWNVCTLVREGKSGHDQTTFNRQPKPVIYEETLILLTEVYLHCSADFFAGSITSNVTRFIGLNRADPGNTVSMDAPCGSNFASYFSYWNSSTCSLESADS